jgi:hypothetical protein
MHSGMLEGLFTEVFRLKIEVSSNDFMNYWLLEVPFSLFVSLSFCLVSTVLYIIG